MDRNSKGQFIKGCDKTEKWYKAMEKRRGENHKMWKGGHPENWGIMVECACGCGEMINKYGSDRKERKYKIFHHRIGKKSPHTEETRIKIGEKVKNYYIDKKPHNWIEDRSKLAKRQERNDTAYKEWRINVYKRDNYKCRINNQDCKGRIIAHHILSWTNYPELRYEINNGITLCQAHHPRKRAEEKRLIPFFMGLVPVSSELIWQHHSHTNFRGQHQQP
jgi:hypothetical protein